MKSASRRLITVADDFGIGPETSRAILELACRGVVTGAVLLVNSPFAEAAAAAWRRAGPPADLGWHPCLTMDAPTAPIADVYTLLGQDGRMRPLREFVPRILSGRVRAVHVERELAAQYRRFHDLAGGPPLLVNAHQHVALFGPVGAILRRVLGPQFPPPFLRRLREPWALLATIPGARTKRGFLNALGRTEAKRQERDGFPGADWMLGITDPRWVRDPQFWPRWLARVPGRVVELMCHPGHADATLLGRDCQAGDGLLQRRVDEYARLCDASFIAACGEAGFALTRPADVVLDAGGRRRAA